jgi:hypothetical protein
MHNQKNKEHRGNVRALMYPRACVMCQDIHVRV